MTIVVAAGAFFAVPTWPQKVKWVQTRLHPWPMALTLSQLTEAERARLLSRLDKDSDATEREKFAWKYVRQAFLDPLVWGYALLYHGFSFVLYTLSLFMVFF